MNKIDPRQGLSQTDGTRLTTGSMPAALAEETAPLKTE
jgi:hypothetical protein